MNFIEEIKKEAKQEGWQKGIQKVVLSMLQERDFLKFKELVKTTRLFYRLEINHE